MIDTDSVLSALSEALGGADTEAAIANVRSRFLGSDGSITQMGKVDFKSMSRDERRTFGRTFNLLKKEAERRVTQAREDLSASQAAARHRFDPTLPAPRKMGAVHPIFTTQMEVEDIFRSMGFQVFAGDHAVPEFDNFDALNIPSDHPARDMQDTFWLDNGMVLRTHTSSMQNRAMRELGVPLRAIFPGVCFRNEATDLTHENTFYQLEGLMVDRDVTVAHLIAVMQNLLSSVFRRDIEVRLRPGFFPFVEPGFELDFKTVLDGKERWVELMPCGMVHPVVLRNAGIDPNEYSGFAFGLGLTRLAMLKHGIPDVRLFNSGDLHFHRQFSPTL